MFLQIHKYIIKQITSTEYLQDSNNFITLFDPKNPVKKGKGSGCLINISRLKDKPK